MKRILNHHKIRHLKRIEDYINYCDEIGGQEFIEQIRVSGVLINPYDTESENEAFIEEIEKHLVDKYKSDVPKWQSVVEESKIINDLYSDLYSMDLYKMAKNVPAENAFISFAIILEKYLRSLINKIEGNEVKNGEISFEFYSEHAYKDNKTDTEKYIDMYDNVVCISDMILKYLLFYKCSKVSHDVETTDEYQKASFAHIEIADQKSVVQNIEKEWRFFNRTINREDKKVESYCESKEFLDFHIVRNRISSRKNKIMNDIWIGEDAAKIISKENGLSDDEKSSILYLKNVLAIEHLSYMCEIHKRNNEKYKVCLSDLVRAYAVIQRKVDKFIDEEQVFSNKISEVCLIIEEADIVKEFVENGISKDQAEILVQVLKYESYKDIFDTPLISYNNKVMLIPSMVQKIDIAQVVLSCVNQFYFRGEAFEKNVLNLLQEAGIKAISKRYRDESGEYQCDVLFGINKTLFVCECKAWGEPHSINSYCERNGKCFDAFEQINRIAQKYESMKDELSKELGMQNGVIRTKKIVLLSNAVGIENMIEDVCFVDYSAFHMFIERKKPSINLYHNKTIYQHQLSGFKEFEGKITENKISNYIANSSPVQLMIKNTDKQVREMPMLKYSLKYDVYTLKENDFLMPDRDIDDYLNSIETIYPV